MAKNHGAKEQKRLAKQKAKRLAKRANLSQRDSNDPNIRLRNVASWPVTLATVGADIWKGGIGQLLIVRREPEGRLVYAVYLVDVFCLGVKNAFWRPGDNASVTETLKQMQTVERMTQTSPACLAKIVKGAVEYARDLGFPPHPDYRHASLLLDGIDLAECPNEFTFGKDGHPLYIQGPNESPEQALAIMERMRERGGHFIAELRTGQPRQFQTIHREPKALELDDENT
jgi:hypothetical protein